MQRQPTMTAAQATTFGAYSVSNAAQVKRSLACGCEPYRDVFTYNRWKAQGFQVQRGEKAIKIPVVKVVATENKDTGAEETRKLLGTGAVFCRHQVEPANGAIPQPQVQPVKADPAPENTARDNEPIGFVNVTMSTWREI